MTAPMRRNPHSHRRVSSNRGVTMTHSPSPDAPSPERSPQPGQSRRSILFGAGAVGAAVVADRLFARPAPARLTLPAMRDAAHATTARPAWLAKPASTPSKAD